LHGWNKLQAANKKGNLMKSGFIGGLLTGFALAALAAGWFVAAHRIVPALDTPANVPLPVPAYAGNPNTRECTPVYFAATADGKIMRLPALKERYITDAALVSWAAQVLAEALTFGFDDWMERMRQSAIHFSPQGWQEFHNALAARNLGAPTVERRETFTSAPARAPVIRQLAVRDGLYTWVVEQPMIGTIAAAQNPQGVSAPYAVTVTIQRSRDPTKVAGIEITGFRFSAAAQ